ncbi:CYTH domain-containing protein [Candidatus Saccharibacteria bacterium]|nr:MAG: CYTH domain-containing protein [Candidatus Saccharibacteria bacterium]
MKPEIEAKFMDIDIDDVRARLTRAGASCTAPMRLMRRVLIETEQMARDDAFVRLRDEGDKVTLTYKQFHGDQAHSASEHEVPVSGFDTALEILKACGLMVQTYQESKRETWQLGECEVVIDEWPWMNPYIEIEGESEAAVKKTAGLLGFDWAAVVFGGADVIYQRMFPRMTVRGVIDVPEVRFGDPVPKVFGKQLQ